MANDNTSKKQEPKLIAKLGDANITVRKSQDEVRVQVGSGNYRIEYSKSVYRSIMTQCPKCGRRTSISPSEGTSLETIIVVSGKERPMYTCPVGCTEDGKPVTLVDITDEIREQRLRETINNEQEQEQE